VQCLVCRVTGHMDSACEPAVAGADSNGAQHRQVYRDSRSRVYCFLHSKDYTLPNSEATARRGGNNMSHHSYSYLERRYSKKTRLQVLLLVTGVVVVLIGAIATVQLSETDAEKNARVESELKSERSVDRKNLIEQQEYDLRVSCEQGKAACDKALEQIRKQNCQMFGENCQRNQKLNSTASYPTIP